MQNEWAFTIFDNGDINMKKWMFDRLRTDFQLTPKKLAIINFIDELCSDIPESGDVREINGQPEFMAVLCDLGIFGCSYETVSEQSTVVTSTDKKGRIITDLDMCWIGHEFEKLESDDEQLKYKRMVELLNIRPSLLPDVEIKANLH
jgi:hypothetical protein